jgi:hypothetical protein
MMKKLALIFLLLLSFYRFSTAQEIKAYKTFGGVRFETDTLTLGLNQVIEILKENPLAYEEIKRAKKNYNAAGVLGFTGAILVVTPLITTIAGGEPEWGLAAGGAALILSSIPFTTAFRGHTMEALDIYNARNKTARLSTEWQFYGTGARLIIRF